jgi:hypothetical protein
LRFVVNANADQVINMEAFSSVDSDALNASVVYVAQTPQTGSPYLSLTMFTNASPVLILLPVSYDNGTLPLLRKLTVTGTDLGESPISFNWLYSMYA